MTVRNHHTRRPSRLAIERLEARENPSGSVTATLSASGSLSLTGDVNDNDVQISLTAGGAVVTGLNGTTITANGSTGASATFNDSVSSLRASLKGGNDHLSIDSSTGFALSGSASINLGSGDNTLDLVTNGVLNIGGNLRVRAGTDHDTVNIRGGANSSIGGNASLLLGAGGSTVDVEGISIGGRAGLRVAAGLDSDIVNLNGLVVSNGGVSISGGTDQLTVNVNGTNTIAGRLSVSGRSGVDVGISSGMFGGLSVSGGMNANTNVNIGTSATVNGNLKVSGFNVDVESPGTLDVTGNADIKARGDATLHAAGADLTIGKRLFLSAHDTAEVNFATTGAATIGGLTVSGGVNDDSITANGNLSVGGNLLLSLHGGDNHVSLLGAGNDLDVQGNLLILAGSGNDTVTLDQVKVTGHTVVALGAGNDTFTARNGTVFSSNALIDLGAGADVLSLANNVGATGGVTFGGRAIINGGVGDDSLNVGLLASAGGNANTVVTFDTPGSILIGGLGIDSMLSANIINLLNLTLVGIP